MADMDHIIKQIAAAIGTNSDVKAMRQHVGTLQELNSKRLWALSVLYGAVKGALASRGRIPDQLLLEVITDGFETAELEISKLNAIWAQIEQESKP
jgi:hypothetical protein